MDDGRIGRCKRQEAINDGLKCLHVAHHHFGEKAVLACDVIRLDHLRRVEKHLRHSFYFTGSGVHPNMRGDAKAKNFGIDQNRITPDRARIFQFVYPLGHTGAGHSDLVGKVADRHAAVFGRRAIR